MNESLSEENISDSKDDSLKEGYALTGKRKKKRKSKKKHNKKRRKGEGGDLGQFIEIDAEEDEDEEEDVDDEDAELDIVNARKLEADVLRRRKRPRYAIQDVMEDKVDSNYYIRHLEEKDQVIEKSAVTPEMARQIFIPTAKDPSLWFVKCKRGSEKLACVSLLNKAFVKARQKDPLHILSVTCLNNIKGFIYIEAYKEAHVRKAIEGLQCIGNKVTLVPINEMNEIYAQSRTKKNNLKKGDWVRIKSGIYTGDLGRVVEVNLQMTKAKIKLVPRLDTGEAHMANPLPGKKKTKKTNTIIRPPQKLFNHVQYDCNEVKRDPNTLQEFYHWLGMDFRNGFLYKNFTLRQLKIEDINPTLAELQMFNSSLTGEDEEDEKINLMLLKEKQSSGISKGDKVRVNKGDLTDLKGTVISMNGTLVTIQPISDQIKHNLTFPVSDLDKYFQMGDNVRVIRGQNQGESGIVTTVEKGIIYIFSEAKGQEIEARANDIQSGTEIRAESTTKHNYRANDLVIFNNNKSAGIILNVSGDSVNVLDSYGDTKLIRIQDINSKRESNHIQAVDAMRNSIAAGDPVRIIDGENKGKRGTIVHIYKDYVFLHNGDVPLNNGFFVERRRNLLILGAEMLRGSYEASREKRAKTRAINPKRDDLYGKLVKIESGAYKGYQGIVIEVDKLSVKVELSSKPKVINVDRGIVKLVSEKTEEEAPVDHEIGTKTPAYFPQSPNWAATTPAPQSSSYADPSKQFGWVDCNN